MLEDVKSSFLEHKTMMDVSINDSEYHSNYLRMLQIDILTGKGRVVACVDVNERCFFLKLFDSEEVANGLENLNMKSKIRFSEHEEERDWNLRKKAKKILQLIEKLHQDSEIQMIKKMHRNNIIFK